MTLGLPPIFCVVGVPTCTRPKLWTCVKLKALSVVLPGLRLEVRAFAPTRNVKVTRILPASPGKRATTHIGFRPDGGDDPGGDPSTSSAAFSVFFSLA